MKILSGILTVIGVGVLVLLSSSVRADGPYLAMAGYHEVALLNLTDFSRELAIDVSPIVPWLTFSPGKRRLYVWNDPNGVLDFDICSGTLYPQIDADAISDFISLTSLASGCHLPSFWFGVATREKLYLQTPGGDEYRLAVVDKQSCDLTLIDVPGIVLALARSRAGDKVYALSGGNEWYIDENAVTVIDTATDQASVLPLNRTIGFFSSLVPSPDETSLYIAMSGYSDLGSAIGVLNLQSGTLQQYPIDVAPNWGPSMAIIDRLGFQCGDGVVETACGEQCDPPGSALAGGGVCDLNCTTGCGNGIASGTEQCDDGNTNDNDGCKSDCTWNVCGDGVVRRGVEQCDDGALNGTDGDACDANCHLPPRTASANVVAGGTLTTDQEGDGATAAAPVETWVTSPLAGSVSIEEGAPDSTTPSGYAFLGYSVHVTVPSSTADDPIRLVFELHSSLLPQGSNQTTIEFSKNGEIVFDCAAGGSAASPDPCVASRELLANGNLRISIRSSTASYWGGLALWHDASVMPRRGVSLTIPAGKLLATRKMPVRVRNADPLVRGKKVSTAIQLTATNVDCPLGLIADVPDFEARKPFAQDAVTLAPHRTRTAKLRLVAWRFAFPKASSPLVCTIKLSAAALVVDNVDPTPADNTTTVRITVTTR